LAPALHHAAGSLAADLARLAADADGAAPAEVAIAVVTDGQPADSPEVLGRAFDHLLETARGTRPSLAASSVHTVCIVGGGLVRADLAARSTRVICLAPEFAADGAADVMATAILSRAVG
jgi:hypothetical protein